MGFRLNNNLRQRQSPLEEDMISGLQGVSPGYAEQNMLADLPPAEFTIGTQQSPQDYQQAQNLQRMTINEPPRQLLRQQIGNQVAESAQAFQEGAKERGALSPSVVEGYKNRGIQIAGKVVAQKEFDDAVNAQNRAIKQLVETSGIKDQNMKYKFAQEMRDKLTKARIELLKFGQQAELAMAKKKADAAQKQAMMRAIGQVAGAVVGGIVAGPAGAGIGAGAGGAAFAAPPTSTLPRNTTADSTVQGPSFSAQPQPQQQQRISTAQPGDTGMRGDF